MMTVQRLGSGLNLSKEIQTTTFYFFKQRLDSWLILFAFYTFTLFFKVQPHSCLILMLLLKEREREWP